MTFLAHVDEFLPYPPKLWSFFALSWGWGLGVDVFFVISGFLITRSLLSSMGRLDHKGVLKSFWIKRVYRIMPASLVWIMLSMVSAWAFLPPNPEGFGAILRSGAAAVTNVMNFWFSYCADTKQLNGYCGGMHTLAAWWSLALEEQFYIVFPLLLLGLTRMKVVLLVCVVIAIYAFQHKAFFNLATSTRMEGICLGVVLAISLERVRWVTLLHLNRMSKIVLGLSAILIPILAGSMIRFLPQHSLLLFFVAMIGCLVLVFLATRSVGVFEFGMISRMVERLGVLSFSFYLCHQSVLVFTSWLFQELGYRPDKYLFLSYFALGFGLSVGVAWLTYVVVEKPFMEKGHRLALAVR